MGKLKSKRFLALIMATMLLITALPVSAATSTISDVENKLKGVSAQRGSVVYDKEGDGYYTGKSDVFIEGKSINNLKDAVTFLKDIAANHETRIAALESTVNNLQNVTIKNILNRLDALEKKEPEKVETKYSFNVLYGFDAGVTDTVSGMYGKGDQITLPVIPKREGYDVIGWEVSGMTKKKNNKDTSIFDPEERITMPERNVVAMAVWNVQSIPTITYYLQYRNYNGTTNYGTKQTAQSNTAFELWENDYARASEIQNEPFTLDLNGGTVPSGVTSDPKVKKERTYTPYGWNTKKNSMGSNLASKSLVTTPLTEESGATVDLYADYTSNMTYTIQGLPEKLDKGTGWKFMGFYTKPNGEGTVMRNGDSLPLNTDLSTFKLYAYFEDPIPPHVDPYMSYIGSVPDDESYGNLRTFNDALTGTGYVSNPSLIKSVVMSSHGENDGKVTVNSYQYLKVKDGFYVKYPKAVRSGDEKYDLIVEGKIASGKSAGFPYQKTSPAALGWNTPDKRGFISYKTPSVMVSNSTISMKLYVCEPPEDGENFATKEDADKYKGNAVDWKGWFGFNDLDNGEYIEIPKGCMQIADDCASYLGKEVNDDIIRYNGTNKVSASKATTDNDAHPSAWKERAVYGIFSIPQDGLSLSYGSSNGGAYTSLLDFSTFTENRPVDSPNSLENVGVLDN